MTDIEFGGSTHYLSPEAERSRRLTRATLVVTAYLARTPIGDICRAYDVSPALVCRYAREAGLTRYQRREAQRPNIVADYEVGLPVAEICLKYEIDRKSVWSFARKAGVPLRQADRK